MELLNGLQRTGFLPLLLLSQESCMSLSLLWTVVVGCLFGYWASMLLMYLVSAVFFIKKIPMSSSFSSNQSWCLRDVCINSWREPGFDRLSSSWILWTELGCTLMVADIIAESLSFTFLFQPGDIQPLWSFLASIPPSITDNNHDDTECYWANLWKPLIQRVTKMQNKASFALIIVQRYKLHSKKTNAFAHFLLKK